MLSAIQIQRHVFTRVEVECHPDCAGRPETEDYEIQVGITDPAYDDAKALWKIVLDVSFGASPKGAPPRYRGNLRVEGYFGIHPGYPEEKRREFLRMNGGSLLLGAVREMVLLITSRGARGPLELATFDARMFLEEGKAGKTARKKAKSSPGAQR